MKSRWLKRSGLAVLVLAVAAGFAWALREQPTPVDTAPVSEAPMRVTIREEGVTRVRDIYTVSAPLTGHLSRTMLEEGDPVEAGKTVVAAIHPLAPPLIDQRTQAELLAARDAARSGVGIAQTELKRAETALRLATEERERALKLFGPGIISESALQKATSEVELQEAAVAAARATIGFREAELASAEARLLQPGAEGAGESDCCVELLAPIDGTVLAVHARSEQAVIAGARIAELGDTSRLEVVVDLLSADAVRVRPGDRAEIAEWGGEAPLGAIVRKIDPAGFTKVSALGIEEQRVNAVLDLEASDERLGHGFRVVAELVVWECEKCLQVPISALFRTGGDWSAFVVEAGRVRMVPLRIGRMNDEAAQLLDGLEAGQTVVVHPSDAVADGSPVVPRG